MHLFEQDSDPAVNILPYEGAVFYHGKIYSEVEADSLYSRLFDEIKWQHDQAIIFGKKIITKRKVA